MSTENIQETPKASSKISLRSFILSLSIILILWIGVYIATLFISPGEFVRDASNIPDISSYHSVTRDFPVWKFFLSPFLLLGSSDGLTIILIIVFLFAVAGAMNSLSASGLMDYLLQKISHKFKDKKYICLAVVVLLFMLLGSFVGSFEEVVPFVPLIVALAVCFGWDKYTGLGMSLIAISCGFAAGILNPFTVGVAQKICGLAMFSGIWLRIVSFILIYALLITCLILHAKKIEKKNNNQVFESKYVRDEKYEKSILTFAIIIGVGVVVIICSTFIKFLQDYTILIMGLMFLLCGIICPLIVKKPGKEVLLSFLKGILGMLPAVLMILFASSIKYILVETKSLDTILKSLYDVTRGLSPLAIVLFIYLFVLLMNFLIPSGSAKAFLIMPLVAPIAQLSGVSLQLCVLAFAFGDGFSNVLYPTNPVLLISLNLVDESYGDYLKKIWKFQLLNLALTVGILVLGFYVGY